MNAETENALRTGQFQAVVWNNGSRSLGLCTASRPSPGSSSTLLNSALVITIKLRHARRGEE